MPLATVVAENAALAGITAISGFATAHVGSPGTSQPAANENANSGGYARVAETWGTPSAGSVANTAGFSFTTAGTVPVTALDSSSSATYGAGNSTVGRNLGASVTAVTITVAVGADTMAAS